MKLKICFLLLFINFSVYSQEGSKDFCNTDKILEIISENPDIKQELYDFDKNLDRLYKDYGKVNKTENSTSRIRIPVVVYVVHDGVNSSSNISDQQVQNQMIALNEYYDIYGIEFCLATKAGQGSVSIPLDNPNTDTQTTPGIIHVDKPQLTNNTFSQWPQLEALAHPLVSRARYLRIWVVNNIEDSSVKGYGMFPNVSTFDGIVMDNDVFGKEECVGCNLDSNFSQGKTLVHEVGHYLGLYHTFFEGCSENGVTECSTKGDRVCDTPSVQQASYSCENYTSCDNQLADTSNFMDYGNECSSHFTEQQRVRMHLVLNNYRQNLGTQSNLEYTGACLDQDVVIAEFVADRYTVCSNEQLPITLTAYPQQDVTYSWDFGDGITDSGSLNTISHPYNSSVNSPYTVKLIVTNNITGEQSATTKLIYVTNCNPINNSNSRWYIGQNAMLNFNTGIPKFDQQFTGNGNYANASAIRNDNSGNLLFYTDKKFIYNSSHIKTNPQNLLQDGDANMLLKNSVLILPNPSNANQSYIFTNAHGDQSSDGFRYSVVNSNGVLLSSVKTPITLPNQFGLLSNPTDNALIGGTGITAIKKSDGYWVFTTFMTPNFNHFLVVYNLNQTGFYYHSIIQIPNTPNGISFDGNGTFVKASPNGNKIALSLIDKLYIYDFNKITGILSSNPLLLDVNGKDASFSPDSNLIYISTSEGSISSLYQIDLKILNPNNSTIKISELPSGNFYGGIQIGPDEKMYVSKFPNYKDLAVINNPNNKSTIDFPNNCQFSNDGPNNAQKFMSEQLPNIVNAEGNTVYNNTISYYPTGCNTFKFFPNIIGTHNLSVFNWEFKNLTTNSTFTISGTNNCPIRTFTAGTYSIKVKIGSNVKAIINDFVVTEMASPVILGSDVACSTSSQGSSNSVVLENGSTAVWSILGGAGTIVGLNNQAEVNINWTALPGTISVKVTNQDGCEKTTTKIIQSSCANGEIGANDFVKVVKNIGNTKYYFAGNFTQYNGVNRNRIAKLNNDMTLDLTFDPGIGVNGSITAMSVDGNGKCIIGGYFSEINGNLKGGIAQLLPSGDLDLNFGGAGFNSDALINDIQKYGSSTLVAGEFLTYNGVPTKNIVRLTWNGTKDLTFDTTGLTNIGFNSIYSVAVQDDQKIIVAGSILFPEGGVVRLNSDGTIDTSFTPFISSNLSTSGIFKVSAMKIMSNGKVLIGGKFSFVVGNTNYSNLARLNPNGTLDTTFVPSNLPFYHQTNPIIEKIDIQTDGKIIIGGFLLKVGLSERRCIARLTASGQLDSTFDPGSGFRMNNDPNDPGWYTGAEVSDFALTNDNKLIVGGHFIQYNNINVNNIVKIDMNSNVIVGRPASKEEKPEVIIENYPVSSNLVNELTDLMVYPNPNNGNFNVQFKNVSNEVKLNVYDMAGRTIYQKKYTAQGNFNENIQLNAVQTGVYLMAISDGELTQVKRIIVN